MFYAFELDLQIFSGERAWVFEHCRIHRKSARGQIIASENKFESCSHLSKMFKTTFSSGTFFIVQNYKIKYLSKTHMVWTRKCRIRRKIDRKTFKIFTGLKFYFVIFQIYQRDHKIEIQLFLHDLYEKSFTVKNVCIKIPPMMFCW